MLTASKIEAAKPRAKRFFLYDDDGLMLDVLPTGTKSWRLRCFQRGKRKRISLGRWPSVSLAAARRRAAEIRAKMEGDRFAFADSDDARKLITFKEFAQKYVADIVGKVRRDPKPVKRWLDRDLLPAWGDKRIASITSDDVRALVFTRRDAGASQAARALRNLVKRIFDYAMVCGVTEANPAHAVPLKFVGKPSARERALSVDEIGVFMRRCIAANERPEFAIALRLILLTLVRKSELRLARWEHIHLSRGEWEIPPELSKTNKGQIVYLSRQAVALFEQLRPRARGNVFPHRASSTQPMAPSTLNRALARIQRGMTHFTVHDLRRTAATRLAEMGYEPDWIEKSLNHTLTGVRGIYNRAQYAEQRRSMLQAWADAISNLETTPKK